MKQYSILLFLLISIACKKEVKQVIPDYKLEVVSGNNINDYNGRYSTSPVVVRITQAGKIVQFYNTNLTFEFENGLCDFKAMGAVKPDVKVVPSTDGNLLLYWYTGEKTGTQPVTFWLVDMDTKTRISSVTISANISQNTEGFTPSCMNSMGSLLHIEDEKYMLFGNEVYLTNNSGLTWEVVTSWVPRGDPNFSIGTLAIKPFNYYHKSSGILFYTGGSTIFQSLDFGKTWQPLIVTKGYIGQLSPDDFLINDFYLGIKKIHVSSNGEISFSNWSNIVGATGLVIDASNKLYINTIDGLLYTSNSSSDSNLTSQNMSIRCDFLYRENNNIYVFSEWNVYQLNGGSTNRIGSIPINPYNKVIDVIKQNNTYYLFSCNIGNSSKNTLLFTGTNLAQLTPSTFKPSENEGLNDMAQKWSGFQNQICIQNESGYWVFKKP